MLLRCEKCAYSSKISKKCMEMVQYQKVFFLVKKLQYSLFNQKWLILGPSGQKSIFFFSKTLEVHLINSKTLTILKKKKKTIKIYTLFFSFFSAPINFFTSKKDLYKKLFLIQIINIRSCAKIVGNAIKSLKFVYSRKYLKFNF